jgi:FkbM family methyltransferase
MTTTVATMEPECVSATTESGRFANIARDSALEVEVTTLDALIAQHGVSAVVKIDVEGFERKLLAGSRWSAGRYPSTSSATTTRRAWRAFAV